MDEDRKDGPRDVCAHVYDDDGIDLRRERRRHDRVKDVKLLRKDEQLAKVAMQAVERVLAEQGGHGGVMTRVVDAEVRGGGSHVLVRVAGSLEVDQAIAERWLASLAPSVRAELAWRLNRRRTPSVALQWCGEALDVNKESTDDNE